MHKSWRLSARPVPVIATLVLFAILCWAPPSTAQVDSLAPRPYVGVMGGYNLNEHSADFRTLPGVPSCCPRFEKGEGNGITSQALYGLPLSGDIWLEFGLGYSSFSATLKGRENTTVNINDIDVPGVFEHTVKADLASIGLEPLVSYELLKRLRVKIGPRLGFLVQKKYEQRETLLEPAQGTFENDRRVRNESSGDIPNASAVAISAVAGVSYHVPLSAKGNLTAGPDVSYATTITPLVADMKWRASSIRAGVSVHYTPMPEPPKPPEPEPVVVIKEPEPQPEPTPEQKKPALSARLSVLDASQSSQSALRKLRVDEYINTQMRPLLNYVFFDEGSATLPSRYHMLNTDEASGFRVERLYGYETLELYYEILNIIGRRLQENPKAIATITGCNSDEGVEKGNRELSRQRAEIVRNYLRDIWNIPEARLKLQVRNLPESASNPSDPDGIVENRRVEITTDSWAVIEPVLTTDTLRSTSPTSIRFATAITSEAGVRSWKLVSSNAGTQLKEFGGEGAVPQSLEWNIDRERGGVLKTLTELRHTLTVTDLAGETSSAVATTPIDQFTLKRKKEEMMADTVVARYSLILFDFDRNALTRSNRRITDFVRQRINSGSNVTITGYTDRMGTDDYNKILSESRAKTTASALGVSNAAVSGVGRSVLLYDNQLPEGRFYCRTVTIVVATPNK